MNSNRQNSIKIYSLLQISIKGKSNIAKKNNDGGKVRQFRWFKGNKKADVVTR